MGLRSIWWLTNTGAGEAVSGALLLKHDTLLKTSREPLLRRNTTPDEPTLMKCLDATSYN